MTASPKKKLLVLFPKEWDLLEFTSPALSSRYEFIYRGFDLFRFPDNVRLLTFNARRFIERMVALGRRERVDGVFSNDEQFGALIAAIVARRLGLPGPEPRAIATAQHKYYCRQAVERIAPEAVPAYSAFPYTVAGPEEVGLPFPMFVKPVKATFSVLARRVDGFAELRRHLRFRPFEKHIIERLIRPFDDLLPDFPELALDAHHIIGEALLEGVQLNLDGFVDRGKVTVLGIIDEVMYPDTLAFARFEYPSALPEAAQERMRELAARIVTGLGYGHGFFNIEFSYNPRDGSIRVIEVNPRMGSQMASLYQWVDGCNPFAAQIALALGEPVAWAPQPQTMARAASFAYRKFDGKPLQRDPGKAQLARVQERHPDAHLFLYLKRGAGLAREMKWLGSYRYAVLNVAGRDAAHLYARYHDVNRILGFDAEGAITPAAIWDGEYVVKPASAAIPGVV